MEWPSMEPPTKKFAAGGPNESYPIAGSSPGVTPVIGEVRYDDAQTASSALALDGSSMGGTIIGVQLDPHSKDGTRLKVSNIPKGSDWQELKDHFAPYGRVAFANVKGGKLQLPLTGVVRYASPEMAATAVAVMHGSQMQGRAIEVKLHGSQASGDATKLLVTNLPPSTSWQDLKDHFASAGQIVFADIVDPKNTAEGVSFIGEIRYDDPNHAMIASKDLHGSILGGSEITICHDRTSKDGSKLLVFGVPAGIEWQDLKDHFGKIGRVAYSNVKPKAPAPPPGMLLKGGMGKGKGKLPMKGMKGMNMKGGGFPMMNLKGSGGFNPMMNKGGRPPMMNGKVGIDPMMQEYNNALMMMQFNAALQQGVGGAGGAGYQEKGGASGHDSSASGGGSMLTGAVQFQSDQHAQVAMQTLNGTYVNGSQIIVDYDLNSADGSALVVSNLSPTTTTIHLEEHFGCIGMVQAALLGYA